MAHVRQPYIYTMPEGFLADPSIGVKWKLYAVINGFWISGKKCYAANKFFAEKLGVSERQIRNGIAQLEEEGYLDRVVYGTSRILMPHAEVYEEAEAGVPPGGSESSAWAEAGVPHISVSISERNFTLAGGEDIEIVLEDESEKKPRKRVDQHILDGFRLFGQYPKFWEKRPAQREAMERLLDTHGAEQIQKALQLHKENADIARRPSIHSPYDLENKWEMLLDFKERNSL